MHHNPLCSSLFFFNDTATTEIYTLSLHDALPIFFLTRASRPGGARSLCDWRRPRSRSEEYTSELQSRSDLVCRLLLEKKTYTSLIAPPILWRIPVICKAE